MKKSIYILLIIMSFTLILNSKDLQNQKDKTIIIENNLQTKKISLEIEKLKKETKTISLTPWLQSGTLIAALIAAAISLFTATRSQRIQAKSLDNQVQQQERERMSNLLKELGSEQVPVKTAAIQALSEYESSYPFIINSLRTETDQGVISLISKVLKKNTKLCIPILIEETCVLHQEKMNIASALITLKIDRKNICSKLDLVNEQLQEWFKTKYNQRNISINNFDFDSTQLNIAEEENLTELENNWKKINSSYNNLATVLEELFTLASRKNEVHLIKNGFFYNIKFNNLNLENWKFENCNFINTSFTSCNLRNIQFSFIIGRNFGIKDCNVNNISLFNSTIKKSYFKNSKGKKLKFENGIFYEVDFSGSNIRYSNYINCQLTQCNLEGSMWAKSIFEKMDFYSCNFKASFFQESIYEKISIVKSQIKTAKFINSTFSDSKFLSMQVERTNFNDSSFTNIKTNRLEFVKSNFDRVKLISSELKNTNADADTTFVNFDNINSNIS